MPRQNYRSECYEIMKHLTSTPEFRAQSWQFNEYKPGNVVLVKIIEDDTQYEPFGSRYRTWQELSHYMRGYMQGFWHNTERKLTEEVKKRICIEVKSPNNVYGNCTRLYLLFDIDGVRREISEFPINGFHVSDTMRLTSAEFREYARIAKVHARKEVV